MQNGYSGSASRTATLNPPMKYAIVIPDGCADEPQAVARRQDAPAGRPHAATWTASPATGVVGRSNNVPPAADAGQRRRHAQPVRLRPAGRLHRPGPARNRGDGHQARARRLGHSLQPRHTSTTRRCATSPPGTSPTRTAARLMATVQEHLGGPVARRRPARVPPRRQLPQHPASTAARRPAPFAADTKTQPPHDIPDRPIADHLPKGPGGDLLRDLMERQPAAVRRTIRSTRRGIARGQKPATQIWLWGQGRAPTLQPFAEVYGKQGAIISAVDLVRGVGMLLGWTRIDVPGATGYLDTDYAAKGRYGVAALQDHDLVCVHVEAPDEASHEGQADAKVKALEQIDEHIVGPLLEALPRHGDWRILVSPGPPHAAADAGPRLRRGAVRRRRHGHPGEGASELRRADGRGRGPGVRPGPAADALVPGAMSGEQSGIISAIVWSWFLMSDKQSSWKSLKSFPDDVELRGGRARRLKSWRPSAGPVRRRPKAGSARLRKQSGTQCRGLIRAAHAAEAAEPPERSKRRSDWHPTAIVCGPASPGAAYSAPAGPPSRARLRCVRGSDPAPANASPGIADNCRRCTPAPAASCARPCPPPPRRG